MPDEEPIVIPIEEPEDPDVKIKWKWKLDTKTVPGMVIVRLMGTALRRNGKPYDWQDAVKPSAKTRKVKKGDDYEIVKVEVGARGPIVGEYEAQIAMSGELSLKSSEELVSHVINSYNMKDECEKRVRKTLLALGIHEDQAKGAVEESDDVDIDALLKRK